MTHNELSVSTARGRLGSRRLGLRGLLAAALAAYMVVTALGCSAEPIPLYEKSLMTPRYLRYTLRGVQSGFFTQTWRSNYLSHPVVFKPGSKVEFELLGDTRIDMRIEGLPAKMYSRETKF